MLENQDHFYVCVQEYMRLYFLFSRHRLLNSILWIKRSQLATRTAIAAHENTGESFTVHVAIYCMISSFI